MPSSWPALPGLVAGSFSMAVGEYVSVRSQHELLEYQIELPTPATSSDARPGTCDSRRDLHVEGPLEIGRQLRGRPLPGQSKAGACHLRPRGDRSLREDYGPANDGRRGLVAGLRGRKPRCPWCLSSYRRNDSSRDGIAATLTALFPGRARRQPAHPPPSVSLRSSAGRAGPSRRRRDLRRSALPWDPPFAESATRPRRARSAVSHEGRGTRTRSRRRARPGSCPPAEACATWVNNAR